MVNSAIHELEGIVTIKRTQISLSKKYSPKNRLEFIREQFKVKLEMVKIALVQSKMTPLYQATLADIKTSVNQHFTDNGQAKGFVSELSRLQAIKLRNQLPDISLSLKMLRDVTKLRIETDKALSIDEAKPEPTESPVAPLRFPRIANTTGIEPISPVDSGQSSQATTS